MEPAPAHKQIGKYDVLEVLGRGGMGVVYKAMDSRIKRLVAIKMMTSEVAKDPDYLKRFYREAQSTGMLQHPNIVVVYDLGDEDGNPYIVMEYLEGIPLDKVISARTELSVYEKLNIVIQMLDGLQYAHQRGIVHRDIKPPNVMVLRDRTVKIVDFGIARVGNTGLTKTGQVIGTINYMSPEQINAAAVDGRSDIFSAAVVLYELLTYHLPFVGKETAQVIMNILQQPAPSLQPILGSAYPEDLDEVMAQALAKDREARYQSAADFAFELARVRDRLKRDMVADLFNRGRAAMERGELGSARDLLQQLVRIDGQHAQGKELLQQLQDQLQQQQRREQVRQLRADAEDAFSRQAYDDALGLADQALSLDRSNADLQKLRNAVQEAKFKKERLEGTLKRAQSAQQSGELEQARRAIEEALSIDPASTQAQLLKANVLKRMDEQSRARQFDELLNNARLNLQSRRYTVASDLLQQAQKIDPLSLELQVLMREAQSAHEEEQKRRELEMLTRQIEEALASDDHGTAWEKCNQALLLAPGDPQIIAMRRHAEQLRNEAQQKQESEQFVNEARRLLAAGKSSEALAAIEAAVVRFPSDTRLSALLGTVRQTVAKEDRDRSKREYLAKARTAMDQRDYAGAVETLKAAQNAVGGSPEIEQLLKFAQEELAQRGTSDRFETIKQQVSQAMTEGNFDQATTILVSANQQAPDPRLQSALAEVQNKADEFRREMGKLLGKSQQMSAAGNVDEAVAILEAKASVYGRCKDFQDVLADAKEAQAHKRGTPQPSAAAAPQPAVSAAKAAVTPAAPAAAGVPVGPPQGPAAALSAVAPGAAAASAQAGPTKSGGKGVLIALALVVLLAILGVVGFVAKDRITGLFRKQPVATADTAASADTAAIEVYAVPWGMVKSITAVDGSIKRDVQQSTPIRVALPPGEYTVVVAGPNGEEQSQTIKVSAASPGVYQPVFADVDVQQVVNSSK